MINSGEIVVKPLESPNVNANPLPQHNADEVNMISVEKQGNRQYLKKVEELAQPSRVHPVKWEYPEGGHAIEKEIALVKVQMNQLVELIVYQHQITRQLINQVS